MMKTLAAAAMAALMMAGAAAAAPVTIVDGTTLGYYNDGIGNVLNGTSIAFPDSGDPSLDFGPGDAPDLSPASAALGNWLSNPSAPGGSWSGLGAIPAGWAINSESAIIYDLGGSWTNVKASFGIDNGIFVWLNGVFLGGTMRPGGAFLGEFVLNLGSLSGSHNYLQILREDHGGGADYSVKITASAVPLPAGGVLLVAGLAALGVLRRRKAA